jgi:hypothetical protein
MNAGLLNQLESYFSEVDADQGPVSSDEVAELIDQVVSERTRTARSTHVAASRSHQLAPPVFVSG